MSTKTNIQNLKINVLTEEQYGHMTINEDELYFTVDSLGDTEHRSHFYGTTLPSSNNYAEGDVFLLCTTPSSQLNPLVLPDVKITNSLYLNDYLLYGGQDTFTSGTYKGLVMNGDGITLTNNTTNGININTHVVPLVDSTQDLGSSSLRWRNVYARDGIITTSDIRAKDDISMLDTDDMIKFIVGLNPVSYKLKDDPSQLHYGLIAQEVEDVIDDMGIEFGGLMKSDGLYGLRYEEFIAPLIKVIQRQQYQINYLHARINQLTKSE